MSEALRMDDGRGRTVAGGLTYVGLFLVTLATLMEEVLLTRIFSVTMWYHYAFVAVSIAMFGMTVGALLVYLRPDRFTPERARSQLAFSSLLFSVSIVVSFLTHAAVPFVMEGSVVAIYSIILTYVVVSVPFVFSGVCVCLALTRFPRQVSKLYAADLAGAAVGCALLVAVLKITDGPTAIVVTASVAAAGSAFFAAGLRRQLWAAVTLAVVLGLAAEGNTILVHRQESALRLIWVKQRREPRPDYEKWNSFSRIRVTGDPELPVPPFGWGLSSALPAEVRTRQVGLNIDATAGTPLTGYDGDPNSVSYLRYDVTNAAHFLRAGANVLVVGPGGGRDILSALTFGQRSVLAVEMNGDIIRTVNGRYGDFTGHLDRNPKVKFVNDEARSYVARQTGRFDIIQISLIDTWAATAAGAYVLAENSLYTKEAWKTFLSRLTPNGVLTVSRWYFEGSPGEAYRLVALATAALLERGVTRPNDHIMLLRFVPRSGSGDQPDGVGTILVSPSPFSPQDEAVVTGVARTLGFEMILSPQFARDPTFEAIASGEHLMELTSHFPIDITPPTDNRPFFFHMLRFRDMFSRERRAQGVETFNMEAVTVLGVLLAVVLVLTGLCIIVPLVRMTERATLRGAGPLLIFFASIGLGFMFVEISQMQRLIVFLGHPTYGLTVVLSSLLLSSGLGSYSTQLGSRYRPTRSAIIRLLILLCGLAAFGAMTPPLMAGFQSSSTPVRILISMAMLFPAGFLMGMPFPLGMRLAAARSSALTPWLWGVNGATSVCASVVAVVIAMSAGISAAFWTGFACYAAALAAFVTAGARGQGSGASDGQGKGQKRRGKKERPGAKETTAAAGGAASG